MSILSLAIGKSKYTVDCVDGEEDKIINLSKKLNERVNNLSLAIRTADEKTILMLCALTAEEELETAKNHNGVFGNQTPEKEEIVEPQISEEDVENAVAAQIENTAEYILKLAKKIGSL